MHVSIYMWGNGWCYVTKFLEYHSIMITIPQESYLGILELLGILGILELLGILGSAKLFRDVRLFRDDKA